jgi:RNA methyltransferase, TrmH family
MYPVYEKITSRQNPKIKNLLLLQKHAERESRGRFIIEGLKEIEKAVRAGYTIDSVFFCPSIFDPVKFKVFSGETPPNQTYEVNQAVYEKIAYRENSGGLVAVAISKPHMPENIALPQNPLILVIEGIEKPGNIGAIYRTADAAGVDAILVSGTKTDFYNPNAIRASLGCVFSVPTIILPPNEAIKWLRGNGIRIFSTHLEASKPYHLCDFSAPSAIVVGTEDKGLSDEWANAADERIVIPMAGLADSMNVSASAAVIIFEAKRQRGFK